MFNHEPRLLCNFSYLTGMIAHWRSPRFNRVFWTQHGHFPMSKDYKFSPKHLNSPTARKAIPVRKKPYRLSLTRGITLLYRRNEGPGTWSVEVASGDGKPWQKKFVMADDVETVNGRDVMTLDQAKEHARKLARADDGPTDGDRPATVKEALEDYKKHLEGRGQGTTHASGLIRRLPSSLAAKPVAMMTVRLVGITQQRTLRTRKTRRKEAHYKWKQISSLLTSSQVRKTDYQMPHRCGTGCLWTRRTEAGC
jgi:hypothetical protein